MGELSRQFMNTSLTLTRKFLEEQNNATSGDGTQR